MMTLALCVNEPTRHSSLVAELVASRRLDLAPVAPHVVRTLRLQLSKDPVTNRLTGALLKDTIWHDRPAAWQDL